VRGVTDTRAAIRAAALELFAARGYELTSLREIAERVGLTKASLYYHYPSKQALLLDLIDPLVQQWRAVAEYAESLPHTEDNVRIVLRRCLEALLSNRPAAGLFVRDAAALVAAIAPIWEELLALSRRMITWLAGPRPSHADSIRALAAMEVLGGALSASLYLPEVSDAELRTALLDSATAALGLDRARSADAPTPTPRS
jgi:AcrR family transcriptional regulator